MTPIEKLVSDLEKFCTNHGSYGREERGAVQLILGEYESANNNQENWVEKVTENMADHILSMKRRDLSGIIVGSESDVGPFVEGYIHGLEMAAAYVGGVEAATVKKWAPPWPLKIPDWPNVWISVDEDCEGVWSNTEPDDGGRDHSWGRYDKSESAGYFEMPLGVNWRTMKIQVKKDGVLIGG